MKKVVFIMFLFLMSVYTVKGRELISENTDYYIKVRDEIINIKKIFDKDTLEVVFNVEPNNYNINNSFEINNMFIQNDKYSEYFENFLCTIIYYGYLINPSDINYYYTQIMIWFYISGIRFTMTNHLGEEIPDLKDDYKKLVSKVIMHDSKPPFLNYSYDTEIWSTNTYMYNDNNIILDNPKINELDINTFNKNVRIYNKNVGNYKLEFTKKYEKEVYCYEISGKPIYCKSLKGPGNIKHSINYNVYGTKLLIKENLIGINNKIGDSYLNSTYEIYLDDELKITTSELNNIYVKSNSNYKVKDISNNNSTYKNEDISFKIEDEEYILEINKYVINKNISVTINNDKKYYVYLKSNNELYEEIDKNTNVIILPYGLYYITDNRDYYLEFNVLDDIDDLLIIGEDVNIEDSIIQDIPVIEDNELDDSIIEEVDNPKTSDNIYYYILIMIGSIFTIILIKSLKKAF